MRAAQEKISARMFELLGLKLGPVGPSASGRAIMTLRSCPACLPGKRTKPPDRLAPLETG
jgi:hypothetical protein